MFGNALKISLRTLYREKMYAAINVIGLALAFACAMILGLYLRTELTYDRHFEGYENIYRIVNEFTINGQVDDFSVTSPMLGPLMIRDNSDIIEAVVRFRPTNDDIALIYEGKTLFWSNVFFATPNVFKVFKHEIIYGDPDTALDEPGSTAISEKAAKAYFGDRNPVGEKLLTDNGNSQTVTLVFKDLPENTHFKYDILYTYNNPRITDPVNLAEQRRTLTGVNYYTYFKMREGYNPSDFSAVSQKFFDDHMREQTQAANVSWHSWIQPLADIHYHSSVGYDQPTGNIYYLYAFVAVAIFILVIACINYMNLSTARSARRAQEVGMLKILGSSRARLITNFLTESLLYAVLALIIAIVVVEVVLTFTSISGLLGKSLQLNLLDEPWLLLPMLAICILIGLLAGLYPALYLSSWQPLNALVGSVRAGTSSLRFRSALVFLQFSISVIVISSTILMSNQMSYVANKSLGFKKENQLVIKLRGADVIENMATIKTELLKNNHVLGVSAMQRVFGEDLGINYMPVERESGQMEPYTINNVGVDKDFIETMGLELVAGRSFKTKLLTDVGMSVIVNEALVKDIGWENPIGKKVSNNGHVVGVVKDFHYASLHNQIEAFGFRLLPENQFENVAADIRPFLTINMIVSIEGEEIRDTLNFLEDKMTEFDPKHPFEFRFLDDSLNKLYQSENSLMELIGIFSGVCIFIACLGLFGLAAFTTEQRTKEIGIRKVLGASATQIIALLSKNILVLVLAGSLIASIVAYLIIDQWLQSFAYRDTISIVAFIIASLAALSIAYLTVAAQSFKTAQSDPSLSIKYE